MPRFAPGRKRVSPWKKNGRVFWSKAFKRIRRGRAIHSTRTAPSVQRPVSTTNNDNLFILFLDEHRYEHSATDDLDLSIPTIICGAFNSVLDPDLDRLHPPTYQRQAPSLRIKNIPALKSLMSSTQTFPVWRTLHPYVRVYSWVHGSGSVASLIDMILAP